MEPAEPAALRPTCACCVGQRPPPLYALNPHASTTPQPQQRGSNDESFQLPHSHLSPSDAPADPCSLPPLVLRSRADPLLTPTSRPPLWCTQSRLLSQRRAASCSEGPARCALASARAPGCAAPACRGAAAGEWEWSGKGSGRGFSEPTIRQGTLASHGLHGLQQRKRCCTSQQPHFANAAAAAR